MDRTKANLLFSKADRFTLAILAGGALLSLVLGHRIVSHFQTSMFYPAHFANARGLFWLNIIGIWAEVLASTILIIMLFERRVRAKFQNEDHPLQTYGWTCLAGGLIITAITLANAILLVAIDRSLLNVWDILFIVIFLGIFYIGAFIYFYNATPLALWEAKDPRVELEKLKIEYEEQKMYLKIFLGITVSFFVSQVFVVLKTKFEPYLIDPQKYSHFQPVMIVNALQIAFLIITIWALVFSRVMRRMEEVKIKLMDLNLDSPLKSP